MNIPMSWLREYADVDCDIVTFTDGMIMSGSNIETFKEVGAEISNIVWGKITTVEAHPDADKLRIMAVEAGGDTPLQIVTAAANVNEGDVIPVALHGATLPGGMKIKTGKLRGIESQGMMCSVNELGFGEGDIEDAPEDGVYICPNEVTLGADVKPYFGLDETVVEYEITSDRPDCFSILGLAREAAATFNKPFRFPKITVPEVGGNAKEMAAIEIQNEELCPRYAARMIQNVKVGPSPKWLKDRLISAGLRPINNIVDVTNYMLLEFGQPMHAFDYDKLADHKIMVRNAKEGEKLTTLLEDEVTLDPSILVIADSQKAIAIAGIMGGQDTKVTEETKTILFECANFKGSNIRVSSKKLGIRSDSSVKYTKGLDPNTVGIAVDRAAQLVAKIGAGEVVSGVIDIYPNKREPVTLSYNPEQINRFLGTNISEDEMVDYFTRLEFIVDQGNKTVTIPTFRPDITIMADLAEEVARLYGYDKIEPTLERGTPTVGVKNREQQITDVIRHVMSVHGIHGAMTYTFESPKVFNKLNIAKDSPLRDALTITNPLGEDFSVMRTSTLNGILSSISTNYNRRNESAALYEVGKVFIKQDGENLPKELKKLTIAMYGSEVDFYTLKGAVESLVDKLRCGDQVDYSRNDNATWMHPGRRADMIVGKNIIGTFGEIHPAVTKNYNIKANVYFAEIDMEGLLAIAKLEGDFIPLPKFPSTSRDIAMLVKEEVLAGDIAKIIKQRSGKILESYKLFDVYKGKQVEDGYKSIAYNISFRAADRTLTEDEISKTMTKIINGLETNLGAQLRDH
ncbi:MAG TPA: phenylalanine--tRNA ligase subunit beta [Epulopiscium sp.]|nr:phenylalanine--tRNA ligase subunit beta [Candidatus Epulonipiscium sp.]